jgi:4-hydroxy-tetrahydrodipicolinate synthase
MALDSNQYSGVFTVIPTFFDEKTENVEFNQINHCINKQYEAGIRKIVILGTTSETSMLSLDEKINIAKKVWELFKDKLFIVIGIGGINTTEVANEAIKFEPYCHALMLSAPYYVKPSQEGLFNHFTAVISSVEHKDFILYNVPSRTGVNLEPDTIAKICKVNVNVKAIKEASGYVSQVLAIKEKCNIKILSGDDQMVVDFMNNGATGLISVISNVFPSETIALYNSIKDNNKEQISKLYNYMAPFMKMAFIESNPVPIKFMLYIIRGYSPFVRMPLSELTEFNKNLIKKYFTDCYVRYEKTY